MLVYACIGRKHWGRVWPGREEWGIWLGVQDAICTDCVSTLNWWALHMPGKIKASGLQWAHGQWELLLSPVKLLSARFMFGVQTWSQEQGLDRARLMEADRPGTQLGLGGGYLVGAELGMVRDTLLSWAWLDHVWLSGSFLKKVAAKEHPESWHDSGAVREETVCAKRPRKGALAQKAHPRSVPLICCLMKTDLGFYNSFLKKLCAYFSFFMPMGFVDAEHSCKLGQ